MNIERRYVAFLLIWLVIACAVECNSGFLLTKLTAQESSSLLDDLLSPTPQQGKAEQQQSNTDKQVSWKEQLSSIAGQMRSAAGQLSSTGQSNSAAIASALRSQKEAINALDILLAKTSEGMSKQKSKATSSQDSGDQQGNGETQSSQSDQASSNDSSQQDANNSQESNSGKSPNKTGTNDSARNSPQETDPSGKTTGQDAKGLPTKETVVDLLKSLDVSGKANWGKLPTRLRDQMQNYGSLEFMPGYERQTRDYYRFLNEAILKSESQTPK